MKSQKQKEKASSPLIYKPDEAFASDAFQKYILLQQGHNNQIQSLKAGTQIKHMIEDSDFYLKNFKNVRDSEFRQENQEDLSQERLRNERLNKVSMNIKIERENIQIIKIDHGKQKSISPLRSRSPQKRNKSLEREHQDISDLEAVIETDEERLLKSLSNKREARAKFVESVRDRQQKVMQINDQIRKYDLNQVKETEIDQVKRQISQIQGHWDKMKANLEDRFKYCEQIHRKHQAEVKDYLNFADDLDANKFSKKIQRITFQLQTDQRDIQQSLDQLIGQRDQLRIFLDRAKRDLNHETKKNKELQDLLVQENSSSDKHQVLREQIYKMRAEMTKISNYSIDMSNNPALAIQKISDPILELMNIKMDDFQQQLAKELSLKKESEKDIIDLKNKIFEQQTLQINLAMELEQIKASDLQLRENLQILQEQIQENIQRKAKIGEKIQAATEQFTDEAAELRAELNRIQSRLKEIYQHKEKLEDQALFLMTDRGGYGTQQKYHKSILEFLNLAKTLSSQYSALKDRILSLDETLKVDQLYDQRKIEDFYKCGKFAEREKADAMMHDLQIKQDYILDLQRDKEDVEEQLAPFATIHFIYKTFNDVQEEVKNQIKQNIRDKNQINEYIQKLHDEYMQANYQKYSQKPDINRINAKNRAQSYIPVDFYSLQYLLQEKVLSLRILESKLSEIPYEYEIQSELRRKQDAVDQKIKSIIDELPHDQPDEDEKLIILRAESFLRKYRYSGQFIRITKNTFKLNEHDRHLYVYLVKQQSEGMIEAKLLARPSIKLAGLRSVTIGTEVYYEFEELIKYIINK